MRERKNEEEGRMRIYRAALMANVDVLPAFNSCSKLQPRQGAMDPSILRIIEPLPASRATQTTQTPSKS